MMSESMKESEINALINLIDDPDEEVFEEIRDRLVARGEAVVPTLESEWEKNSYGVLFQTRIEEIIHEIQVKSVYDGLAEWRERGHHDLLEGVLLIMRYQYPDIEEEQVRAHIERIQRDAWLEMNDRLTAFEKVKVINQVLFDIHGFRANKTNYHDPANSYINNVLETGSGTPLSLSILYLLVAHYFELPIYGVNLPNHFVLAYVAPEEILRAMGREDPSDNVLFYINPFNRGGIFNQAEIDGFLEELHLEKRKAFYYPCDNVTIVRRNLNNLLYSYRQKGYLEKISDIQRLIGALERK